MWKKVVIWIKLWIRNHHFNLVWTSFTIDREKEEFTSLLAGKSKLLKIILQSFCVFVRGSVPKSFLHGPLKLSNYKLSIVVLSGVLYLSFLCKLLKTTFCFFSVFSRVLNPRLFFADLQNYFTIFVVLLGFLNSCFFCGPLLLFSGLHRPQNVTQMIK